MYSSFYCLLGAIPCKIEASGNQGPWPFRFSRQSWRRFRLPDRNPEWASSSPSRQKTRNLAILETAFHQYYPGSSSTLHSATMDHYSWNSEFADAVAHLFGSCSLNSNHGAHSHNKPLGVPHSKMDNRYPFLVVDITTQHYQHRASSWRFRMWWLCYAMFLIDGFKLRLSAIGPGHELGFSSTTWVIFPNNHSSRTLRIPNLSIPLKEALV